MRWRSRRSTPASPRRRARPRPQRPRPPRRRRRRPPRRQRRRPRPPRRHSLRPVSEAEHPERVRRQVTVEDVRQLMGASTPHFALQLRNRIAKLIDGLPADDPARLEGEREIARLERLGYTGEVRGEASEEELPPLPSLTGEAPAE